MKARTSLSILVLMIFLLAACQPAVPAATQAVTQAPVVTQQPTEVQATTPPSTEPKIGGALVAFTSADPNTLDPALISGWDQMVIITNLVEGLFRMSPDALKIENAICESYTVSTDGKVYTFKLRSDAKFHNGRLVEAKDFKYSFERVLNPATQSSRAWILENVVGAKDYESGKATEVTGIKVVDPQTLEITLVNPMAPFIAMLTSPNLSVVPQEEVEKYGKDFGQHVVAAGPFKLGVWNINQDVTLDAFTDYYAGRPYLDAVKFRFIQDENTRIVEFNAGNLDIAWITPAVFDTIKNDPVLKDHMGWGYTYHTEFITINTEKSPFGTNPKLRQAIRYAIDLDAVVASLQDRGTVAQGILPPGLLGFDPNAKLDYPMDVVKAKALMKEAGFADGVPGTFDLILPNWSNEVKLCEIYQANLKEIGININVKPLEWGPYMDALGSGTFDLAWSYRVADYADPDSFYYPLLDSQNIGALGNYARYKNADVDKAIEDARVNLDEATRLQLYKAVDAQFATDLPYIPLFHNIWVDVSQPYVKNYTPGSMDPLMFQRVWLDK